MTVPVNALMWIAAVLPIVALLVLMVALQWPASKAAPVGMAIALAVGLWLYKAPLSLIAYEAGKGIWSAFSVLLVIFPAILIFEVTNEAKAFDVFRVGMQKFSPNELLQIIAIGWVFVSFLQGITGFGVPVAVGAPLLVGIGVSPLYAVVIPLVGHAWGNTFGTLGVAWDSLVQTTGMTVGSPEYFKTALWAAIFLWIFNFTTGVLVCWLYGKMKALKKGLPAIAVISLIQGGGQLLLSQYNPTVATFVPTVVCLCAIFLLGRTPWYRTAWRIEDTPCMARKSCSEEAPETKMTLLQAFMPYIVLTAITFVCLVIKPVNKVLSGWKIGFAFPETTTGYGVVNAATSLYSPIGPLVHAGTFLLLSAMIGFLFFKSKGYMSGGSGKRVVINAWEKTVPSAVAVVMLLIMSKVMSGTGQTEVLAQGTAKALGSLYAVIAPFIGVLGSFMTSSNMASNILFGKFQQTTSALLGLDIWAILGAQTAGGAIGNTICPGNVVLGTTTAGILGQEGAALRKTLPIAVGVAVFIGIILAVLMFAV